MEIKKILELSALIAGFAAVVAILFYLITGWGTAVIFLEPNPYIRIIEIVWGLLAIPFLVRLMIKDG